MARIVVSEADFMRQVTDLATLLGYVWCHFRPAMTSKGYRTPVSGPLGKGWPDLVLVRGERIIFAELKRDGAKPTPEQVDVLRTLAKTGEAYVWQPKDFETVARLLQ